MKINKTNIVAALGSLIAVLAFFAIVGVNNASACDQECEYPPITANCVVSTSRAEMGEVVTWSVRATGGNGYYSFKWTGTDGLESLYQTISIRYHQPGTKTGTVEITSYGETITRTCSVVIEEEEVEEENLNVVCVANPGSVKIGETVQYTANPTGGTGVYTYSWTGTDGLSSSSRTVSKSYNTTGTKIATVTARSGNQTRTATCSSNVSKTYEPPQPPKDNLDGYCTGRPSRPEEGEKVTWTAYPDGGNGNYRYEWSGTDNLDGDDKSITKRYDDEGTKTARVKITSDGESITKTCTVRVDEEEEEEKENDDLEAYCKASPDGGKIGDRIRWTVYPDGGDGDYEYRWDGDDNLSGDDKSVSKTYSTSGRKEAEVRVESDGDRVTVRCHANIEGEINVYIPPQDNGIYLSSLPATGISPGMKVGLFATGITLWSAFLAYLYIARKNEKMKEQAVLESIGE
jgi:hypothetical protein